MCKGKMGLSVGGLIRRVVHLLGKVGLICGGLYAGGGAYRRRNTVCKQKRGKRGEQH